MNFALVSLARKHLHSHLSTWIQTGASFFFYPDEMTNENKKYMYIGAIGNEENQQNVDVFTMSNVQNYILAQRVESTVKEQSTSWTSGWGFFVR